MICFVSYNKTNLSDVVNRVVPQLIARGRYIRPVLGIMADDAVSRPRVDQLGTEGVGVLGVGSGSPAEAAGLLGTRIGPSGELITGDIIQRVDGAAVTGREELRGRLEAYRVGDPVRLSMIRNGREIEVSVVLGGEANGAD